MTAELAVKPPSYEEFCEMQWSDPSWWEWIVEDMFEHGKTLGIYVYTNDLMFDIYHRKCAGRGELADINLFVDTYYDRLSKVSPILTEMFREEMISFKWEATRNTNLMTREYDDYGTWDEHWLFSQGLFKGLSVQELYEAEREDAKNSFEETLLAIIDDFYHDILMALSTEDEIRTSTEEYEEWIKHFWIP